MPRHTSCLIAIGILVNAPMAAKADGLPAQLGQCVQTTISAIGTRFDDDPNSGSTVNYADGGIGISYELVEALTSARIGDPVKLCLVSIPQDCPPGDDRGREYRAVDLRTHGRWTLPDAQHYCGGA